MQKEELLAKIEKLRANFYSKQNKNTFFTSKQKLSVAENVSKSLNQQELTQMTVFVIKDTCKIYVDYTVFKLFANPSNYNYLIEYMLTLINYCNENFGCFEVHVNLDTFTVSACHRYKEVIELYLSECMKKDTELSEKLQKMHLYNIPSVFETIQKLLAPLMHEAVLKKIESHNKQESLVSLDKLFN
uniref:CRAL-TRIO domain-containing protein n=1 Tax=viral metagenome TaxID=1070528 RepID=A0A6C0B7J9_9ZZZZ